MNSTILTLISTDVSMWLFRLTFSVGLIGLTALVMTVVPGRISAAYRHRVWALSLAASLAVPAFIHWLPEYRIGPQTRRPVANSGPDLNSPAGLARATGIVSCFARVRNS